LSAKLKKLQPPDNYHLEAAEGWLELGNHLEANEELERITPLMRAHPFVLEMRWNIYAKAKKWEMAAEVARSLTVMLPDNSFGWIHWAYSLHELKRTQEAWNVLFPMADKFSGEHTVSYNLACYACRLGNLKESLQRLEKAIDLAGEKDIRARALDDPDLELLWNKIGEI
jgi:predicted Zn-dependent protease